MIAIHVRDERAGYLHLAAQEAAPLDDEDVRPDPHDLAELAPVTEEDVRAGLDRLVRWVGHLTPPDARLSHPAAGWKGRP